MCSISCCMLPLCNHLTRWCSWATALDRCIASMCLCQFLCHISRCAIVFFVCCHYAAAHRAGLFVFPPGLFVSPHYAQQVPENDSLTLPPSPPQPPLLPLPPPHLSFPLPFLLSRQGSEDFTYLSGAMVAAGGAALAVLLTSDASMDSIWQGLVCLQVGRAAGLAWRYYGGKAAGGKLNDTE